MRGVPIHERRSICQRWAAGVAIVALVLSAALGSALTLPETSREDARLSYRTGSETERPAKPSSAKTSVEPVKEELTETEEVDVIGESFPIEAAPESIPSPEKIEPALMLPAARDFRVFEPAIELGGPSDDSFEAQPPFVQLFFRLEEPAKEPEVTPLDGSTPPASHSRVRPAAYSIYFNKEASAPEESHVLTRPLEVAKVVNPASAAGPAVLITPSVPETPAGTTIAALPAPAQPQTPVESAALSVTAPPPATEPTPGWPPGNEILLAGCSSCGRGGGVLNPLAGGASQFSGIGIASSGGCSSCGGCGGSSCIPGRKPCSCCEGKTVAGRFLCGVYDCICCPDHCYDPRWIPIADSAFFVDSVRPITTQRFRWESGTNLIFPDRNSYYWASQSLTGVGPKPPVPFKGEKRVDYNNLSLYTEIATNLISIIVETPYVSLHPEINPAVSGFGDTMIGTKTLLFDCELFQIAMEFKTYVPSGNFIKGLGNGNVAIEPNLLFGLRIAPDTYLQTQFAEWIPFGPNVGYAGAIIHSHFSLNQVLYRILPDVPLIGTLEANSWTFQSGSYTDPFLGPNQRSANETYLSYGPGLRLFVCDKIDFGFGTAFAATRNHWAEQVIKSEFRLRY